MKALVTGGSGFIGTRLADELRSRGVDVRILDKAAIDSHRAVTVVGDIRDARAVEDACDGMDIVFHLAAEHRDDVRPISLYEEVNVQGTRNLVEAASSKGIKQIVFTSTVAVYGLRNETAVEDAAPDPFNEYGRSKLRAEELLLEWVEQDRSRGVTIVRPCVVFGEGNRGNVSNLISQIRSGKFIMIGRGGNKKSMAYVGNVVRFLAAQVNAPRGLLVVNYADKPDMTTRDLVRAVCRILGIPDKTRPAIPVWLGLAAGYVCDALAFLARRKLPVSAIRVRKFCAETTVATDRLERMGFTRSWDLEQGLQQMIDAECRVRTVSPGNAQPGPRST